METTSPTARGSGLTVPVPSMRFACAALWIAFAITIAISVILGRNPTWWTESLSHLGSQASHSRFFFNGGAVVVSLFALLLAVATVRSLGPLVSCGTVTWWSRDILVGMLVSIAALIAIVGFIPYDLGPTWAFWTHDISGWGEGWVLGVYMFFLPWLFPRLERSVYAAAWAAVVGILAAYGIYYLGYSTIAITELAATVCAALWMNYFFARLEVLAAEGCVQPAEVSSPNGAREPS